MLKQHINTNAADLSHVDSISAAFSTPSFLIFRTVSKPTISVSGKTVFYNGECWTSDEISCVKCTKWLERVEVYSNGKKVLTFPWELDNSELFIAWVNKCGIAFEDYRMKAFQ